MLYDHALRLRFATIALVMHQSKSKPVSLLQLQQVLGLPLIEIWLGLLLGEQEQYQWETGKGITNHNDDRLRCYPVQFLDYRLDIFKQRLITFY